MKIDLLSNIVTTIALSLGTVFIVNQPSYANDTTFQCLQVGEELDGRQLAYPVLAVSTPRTFMTPLIKWSTDHFKKWNDSAGKQYTQQVRCEELSTRLQHYYDCKLLERLNS